MSFFNNFQLVSYNFGDNENPALFQNLTSYIDLIDQVQDDISYYETIEILDGERPDTLSQKLYDNPNYYWQFFLLNDNIRLQGWPLRYQDALTAGKERYPNRILTTECTNVTGEAKEDYFSTFAAEFTVGKLVTGASVTNPAKGVIIERNLDLGQLVIQPVSGTPTFSATEFVSVDTGTVGENKVKLIGSTIQYDAVHHYEDTDGNWVDIDPFDQATSTSGKLPVTHLERFINLNNDLKKIRCFVPDVANQVNAEFQRLLSIS